MGRATLDRGFCGLLALDPTCTTCSKVTAILVSGHSVTTMMLNTRGRWRRTTEAVLLSQVEPGSQSRAYSLLPRTLSALGWVPLVDLLGSLTPA